MKKVDVSGLTVGNACPLTVIAGPCQLESADHALMIAGAMQTACAKAGAQFIFKGSFDKANRTSLSGKRGLGIDEGLAVMQAVKDALGVPVLTDVHLPQQCAPVAEVCDVLQIPAFLCRQTDLLLAAGETGAVINVKKGQFLAPWDMAGVIGKLESTGNTRLPADRTRHLLWLQHAGGRHARAAADGRDRLPGGDGRHPFGATARRAWRGKRRAARICPGHGARRRGLGIAAVFIETHEDPDSAPSDGPNMIPLARCPR
jgi:2-dehydro-3-deoxyphosphooctonate aldolase (KDO 8-P synthase)